MKYLKKYKINEEIGSENQYHVELKPDLFYKNINYKGNIDPDISCNPIKITFNIEMELKNYGVKSILIYNIKGPEEVEFFVRYYDENDIEKGDDVTIKLNWQDAILINDEKNGPITLNNLEIYLIEEDGIIKQSFENQIEITATYI